MKSIVELRTLPIKDQIKEIKKMNRREMIESLKEHGFYIKNTLHLDEIVDKLVDVVIDGIEPTEEDKKMIKRYSNRKIEKNPGDETIRSDYKKAIALSNVALAKLNETWKEVATSDKPLTEDEKNFALNNLEVIYKDIDKLLKKLMVRTHPDRCSDWIKRYHKKIYTNVNTAREVIKKEYEEKSKMMEKTFNNLVQKEKMNKIKEDMRKKYNW